MFNTPILYLVFNRLDTVKITFKNIQDIKPKQLFIAADGPRNDKTGEGLLCRSVRDYILANIDWDCDLRTLFREENLGCGKAVKSAISWFFESVDYGIILEDDVLVDDSFFIFSEYCLRKYYNDSRIMMVTGHNHLGGWNHNGASFFFSQLGAIWGWGTWRRAWNLNNINNDKWEKIKKENILRKIFKTEKQAEYRMLVSEKAISGLIDTWDYQWTVCRLINSGLCIIPSVNLVANIGFSPEATHTKEESLPLEGRTALKLFSNPIVEPEYVYADLEYDLKIFNKFILNENSENKLKRRSIGYKFGLQKKLDSFINKKFDNIIRYLEVHDAINRGYNQLSNILSEINSYLPITSSSLDYYAISIIINDIMLNKRKFILELGSGVSTIIISKFLKNYKNDIKYISLESCEKWCFFIKDVLKKEKITEYCKLLHLPLTSYDSKWYDLKALYDELSSSEKLIDCLIIDGPPAWAEENCFSRSFALDALYSYLSDDACVFLDDANREGELFAIQKWSKQFNLNFNIINNTLAVAFKGKHYNIF